MKKDDISFPDWQRILLGEAPVEFLLEVLFRSIVTYCVLIIVLKLMGKRMSGRLTNTEMAVMLMFGAIVSSAMQIPERGVLEGSFALLLILVLQRLFTLVTVKKPFAEKLAMGTISLIVKNGVLQLDSMKKELLSRNQLFRILRSKKISQLGELKRVYMETNGSFTIMKYREPVPGISVMPDSDPDMFMLFENDHEKQVCSRCGQLRENETGNARCTACGYGHWEAAVVKKVTNEKT